MKDEWIPEVDLETAKIVSNQYLLKELQLSKASYGEFETGFEQYHMICEYEDITIEAAKEIQRKLLVTRSGKISQAAKKRGIPGYSTYRAPETDIPIETITFRVHDWSYVPEADEEHEGFSKRQKRLKVGVETKAKVPFKPYRHYVFRGNLITEVGRTHWQGDLINGSFEANKGEPTKNLCLAWMLMAEKYGRRANWRHYSYVDEMQSNAIMALLKGGLTFDEQAQPLGPNPFAFYSQILKNSFTQIQNNEKKIQTNRDTLLIASGYSPSYSYERKHEYDNEIKRNGVVESTYDWNKQPAGRPAKREGSLLVASDGVLASNDSIDDFDGNEALISDLGENDDNYE